MTPAGNSVSAEEHGEAIAALTVALETALAALDGDNVGARRLQAARDALARFDWATRPPLEYWYYGLGS